MAAVIMSMGLHEPWTKLDLVYMYIKYAASAMAICNLAE